VPVVGTTGIGGKIISGYAELVDREVRVLLLITEFCPGAPSTTLKPMFGSQVGYT